MSDPWLSFGENVPTAVPGLDGSASKSSVDESELALFPGLLDDDLDENTVSKKSIDSIQQANRDNARKIIPKSVPSTDRKNATQVVKVKVVPVSSKNQAGQEEELIQYLMGKCQNTDYELEHIVDVTGEVDDDLSAAIHLNDLDSRRRFGESCSTYDSDQEEHSQILLAAASVSEISGEQILSNTSSGSTYGSGRATRTHSVESSVGRPNQSLSRSALAARENRMKKKSYISGLENSVKVLKNENTLLKTTVGSLSTSVDSLRTEVTYLKNVLANQSALSSLLKNTLRTPGVQFVSSGFGVAQRFTDEESPSRKPHQRSARKRQLEEDLFLSSEEEEEDAAPDVLQDSRSVPGAPQVSTQMSTRSRSKKCSKLDHDYASGKLRPVSGVGLIRVTRSKPCVTGKEDAKENMHGNNNNTTVNEQTGGICLHVSNKTVSIEFCAECSKKASATRAKQQSRTTRSMEQVQV